MRRRCLPTRRRRKREGDRGARARSADRRGNRAMRSGQWRGDRSTRTRRWEGRPLRRGRTSVHRLTRKETGSWGTVRGSWSWVPSRCGGWQPEGADCFERTLGQNTRRSKTCARFDIDERRPRVGQGVSPPRGEIMSSAVFPALAGPAGTAIAVDCRVYPRLGCDVPIQCQPPGAMEQRWDAIIRDVSLGGCRLSLRRRFERGSCLALALPGRNSDEASTVSTVFVKVVHLHSEGGGVWSLGCQLVGEFSQDALDRLVGGANDSSSAGPPPAAEAPATTGPVVHDVLLRVECPNGGLVRCRIQRFRARQSWPPPHGKIMSLRGVPIHGNSDTHRFRVLHCDLLNG